MSLGTVLNQKVYPGAGDVDDCWVVATVQAVRGVYQAPVHLEVGMPTVPEFRSAAGDPDDGVKDGGSLDEIMRAVHKLWPGLSSVELRGFPLDKFFDLLKEGGTASIAVWAGALPRELQFGFTKAHQVAVDFTNGHFRIANPLAPQGSRPVEVLAYELAKTINAYSLAGVFGVYFPEDSMKYRFNLERWFVDGKTTQPIVTFGAPLKSDGSPDYAYRLAYLTDAGGLNPRLELFPRSRLSGATDAATDAELEKAVLGFSIPRVDTGDERVAAIKQKVAEFAAEIAADGGTE